MPTADARRRWIARALVAAALYGAYELNVSVQTRLGTRAVQAAGLAGATLPQALAAAQAGNKPVLAEVSAIWCPTCRAFDRAVLSDPFVNSLIKERFSYARLEYESPEGREFSARFGLNGFPRFVVLDGNGALLSRVPADFNPAGFRARLEASANEAPPPAVGG